MGNAAYDERRRLRRETAAIQENLWMKNQERKANSDEVSDTILKAVAAFLNGTAYFTVTNNPDYGGHTRVHFNMPWEDTSNANA